MQNCFDTFPSLNVSFIVVASFWTNHCCKEVSFFTFPFNGQSPYPIPHTVPRSSFAIRYTFLEQVLRNFCGE